MKTSNNEIKIISPGMERRKLTNKIHLLDENKFIALSKKIDSSFNVVQEKYKELNKVASPVVENEYLWGLIKTTDVEKSLDGLLKVIQELAKCTLGAFQANSENLEAILELMKISVSIEMICIDNWKIVIVQKRILPIYYMISVLNIILTVMLSKFSLSNHLIEQLL